MEMCIGFSLQYPSKIWVPSLRAPVLVPKSVLVRKGTHGTNTDAASKKFGIESYAQKVSDAPMKGPIFLPNGSIHIFAHSGRRFYITYQKIKEIGRADSAYRKLCPFESTLGHPSWWDWDNHQRDSEINFFQIAQN